ncbi:MAG: hypothetical protein QOI37_1426 [Chloroflexota bacterium]|jgi:aminoglycoside phosphotransferase (APT) family kinase protein|nr:hypothetical protein [Chloroflexota bacterium]
MLLVDGRRLAVTVLPDTEASASVVALTAGLHSRLRAAGVPAPAVVEHLAVPGYAPLVTGFVDGTPGGALLDTVGGPAMIGSLLGATWRRLACVDTAGLALPTSWTEPERLALESTARSRRVRARLTASEGQRLSVGIAPLAALLAHRRPGFVHGDFVPVNVLVDDGMLVALLDFESARLGEPLLDAAWFRCIVAYHHPAEEAEAWRAFAAAADLDTLESASPDLLRILPLIRLLEILDDDRLSEDRADHWIGVLRSWLARWP